MRAWILLLGSLLLPGVVDGINSCVDPNSTNYKCEAGANQVRLNGCGLTDADIPDVEDCLDTVGRGNIISLYLEDNSLSTPTAGLFQGLGALVQLYLNSNNLIALPLGLFNGLGTLAALYLEDNDLPTLLEGLFNDLEHLGTLYLENNQLTALPLGVFAGLGQLGTLRLDSNDLTTLPEGLFNDIESLGTLKLEGNDRLQCVPDTDADVDFEPLGPCECTPPAAVMCYVGHDCAPGASGYTCGTNSCVDPDSADYRCEAGANQVHLEGCGLTDFDTPDVEACLDTVGRGNIISLYLEINNLTTPAAGLFQGLVVLVDLYLNRNNLIALPPGLFDGLGTLDVLDLANNQLTALPLGVFDGLGTLAALGLDSNDLTILLGGLFNDLDSLRALFLQNNQLIALPLGVFAGLGTLASLSLEDNDLTTLPEGLFNDLGNLGNLYLTGNNGLQCIPHTDADVDIEPLGSCECTPPAAVMCEVGLDCAPGASGYTCEMAMHKLGGEPHLSDVRSTDIV